MNAQQLKDKWRKDGDDSRREGELDEQRLGRCQYRIQYEPYSWCALSDNICLEDSGNQNYNAPCENNTEREEKDEG